MLNSVEHWTDLLDLPKWSVGDSVIWTSPNTYMSERKPIHGRVEAIYFDQPFRVRLDDGSVVDPRIAPDNLVLA